MADKRVSCSLENGQLDFHRPNTTISVLKTAECQIGAVWTPGVGTSLVEVESASTEALKCGEEHA